MGGIFFIFFLKRKRGGIGHTLLYINIYKVAKIKFLAALVIGLA